MQELVAMPTLNENVVPDQMEPGEFEEPVEILVKLAQDGEIDPWNIDIVDVTDKFFRHVEKLERMDFLEGLTWIWACYIKLEREPTRPGNAYRKPLIFLKNARPKFI